MWREYTRETPARPGLALIATVVAFLSTCGLAWYLTHAPARHLGTAPTLHAIRLSRWPIAFEIPEGYEHVSTMDDEYDRSDVNDSSGYIEFLSTDVGLNRAPVGLRIEYQLMRQDTSTAAAFRRLALASPSNAEPTQIGLLPALKATSTPANGLPEMKAVACSPEGLAVMVEMIGPRLGPHEEREFLAVCASVEHKKWTLPP